jgi:plastocyanin
MRNLLSWRRLRMCAIALVTAGLPMLAGTLAAPVSANGLDSAPRTWHVSVGVQTPTGRIAGMIFTPSHIFVKQGDTIVWTAGAQEIHTVTFGTPPADTDDESAEPPLPPIINAFEEFEEAVVPAAGGHTFTGGGYYNSGLMTTVPAASGFPTAVEQYALQIEAAPGDYFFYCLVHGPMMSQLVTIIPNGAAYPFSQGQYDAQAATERARVYAEGFRAFAQTEAIVSPNTVYVGAAVDTGMADVMRFVRGNTIVKVGSWVTFKNLTADPHTVTIGDDTAIPGGGLLPFGNLADIEPGMNYSSGIIGHAFGEAFGLDLPNSVSFHFGHTGVYHFFCALHDYEGMVGTITVVP